MTTPIVSARWLLLMGFLLLISACSQKEAQPEVPESSKVDIDLTERRIFIVTNEAEIRAYTF